MNLFIPELMRQRWPQITFIDLPFSIKYYILFNSLMELIQKDLLRKLFTFYKTRDLTNIDIYYLYSGQEHLE